MKQNKYIEYHQSAIEDIDFPAESFDVVFSSLALHYIQHFDVVCEKVHRCLTVQGSFIMSVEHPLYTHTKLKLGTYWLIMKYQQDDRLSRESAH